MKKMNDKRLRNQQADESENLNRQNPRLEINQNGDSAFENSKPKRKVLFYLGIGIGIFALLALGVFVASTKMNFADSKFNGKSLRNLFLVKSNSKKEKEFLSSSDGMNFKSLGLVGNLKQKTINKILLYHSEKNLSMALNFDEGPELRNETIKADVAIAIFDKEIIQVEADKKGQTKQKKEVSESSTEVKYKAYLVVTNMSRTHENDTSYFAGIDIFNNSELEEFGNDTLENYEIHREKIREVEQKEMASDAKEEKTSSNEENSERTQNEEVTSVDVDPEEFIDTLPVFQFAFFKNGTISDLYVPKKIMGFVDEHIEDILAKLVPILSQDIFENSFDEEKSFKSAEKSSKAKPKFKDVKRKLGYEPGRQKLFEVSKNGKFTNIYHHECLGIKYQGENFKGSRMNADTKIRVNNEKAYVESIFSKGGAKFVSTEEGEEDSDKKFGKNFKAYQKVDDVDDLLKDNIIRNPLREIGSNFTLETKLISIHEDSEELISKIAKIRSKISTHHQPGVTKWDIYESLEDIPNLGKLYSRRIMRDFSIPHTNYKGNLDNIPKVKTLRDIKALQEKQLALNGKLFPDQVIEFQYNIFKFNLGGVTIALSALVHTNPQTGYIALSAVLSGGSAKLQFQLLEKKSNLGKVIGRAIVVVDAAVQFIHRLNEMTGANATQWITFISQEFANVIPILKNVFDVSDTFKETFGHILEKIKEATGKFFHLLATGVEKANNFLDWLIGKVEKIDLDEIKGIIKTIINEFLAFIRMTESALDGFHQASLVILQTMETLATATKTFTVEGLVELTDKIGKVRTMYSSFVEKLFLAIPDGIENFHKKVSDGARGVLQKIMNVISFIENALRSNPIVIAISDGKTRNDLANQLKSFNEKISHLLELVINQTHISFNETVEGGGEESIKNKLALKLKKKLEEFDKKSKQVLENIKKKISGFAQFVLFVKNIDALENIQNEVQQTIFDAYDEYFVETLKEDNDMIKKRTKYFLSSEIIPEKNTTNSSSTEGQKTPYVNLEDLYVINDDIKIRLDEITKTAVNKFIEEIDDVKREKVELISKLKQEHYPKIVEMMKSFTENIKNYEMNEFLQEFNNTCVLAPFNQMAEALKMNYAYARNYTNGIITKKAQWESEKKNVTLALGDYYKYDNFTEKIGVFFNNSELNYTEKILPELLYDTFVEFNKTLDNSAKTIQIPKNITEIPQLAFLGLIKDELLEAIEAAESSMNERFYNMTTKTFVENSYSKPLSNLNERLASQLSTLRKPFENPDEFEFAESEDEDICYYIYPCKTVDEKQICYKEPVCFRLANYSYYVQNVTTTSDFKSAYEVKERLAKKYSARFSAEIAGINNEVNIFISKVNTVLETFGKNTTKVEKLIDEFHTNLMDLANNKMTVNLLNIVYASHRKVVLDNLELFYGRVTKKFQLFGSDFINGTFIETLKELVAKPTEILQIFNSIRNTYLNGTGIFKELQNLVWEEINAEINGSYANALDNLDELPNRLISYIPDDLLEKYKGKIQIVKAMSQKATGSLKSLLKQILDKDYQCKLLNKDKKDAFELLPKMTKFENVISETVKDQFFQVDSLIKDYKDPHIDHDLAQYQIIKITEIKNFFIKTIAVIQDLLNKKDFDITNLVAGYLNKFESSLGNNINKIILTMKSKIDGTQNTIINSILPYFKQMVDEVKNILENSFSLNEIKNNLGYIRDNAKKHLKFFQVKEEMINFIKQETAIALNQELEYHKRKMAEFPENKCNFNAGEYNKSFHEIKELINEEQEKIIKMIDKIQVDKKKINERIIAAYKESLGRLKSSVDSIKEVIKSTFSFEILGNSIDFATLVDEPLYEVVTKIEHSIDYTVNDFVNSIVLDIKADFIEEIEGLNGIVSNFTVGDYEQILYLYFNQSHQIGYEKYTIDKFEHSEDLGRAIKVLSNEYTPHIDSELVENYINSQLENMESTLRLKNITENVEVNFWENGATLEDICQRETVTAERIIGKSVEFVLTSSIQKIVKVFAENIGKNFIEKINRRIFVNGINPIVDFIATKVQRLVEILRNLLGNAPEMSAPLKLATSQLFPIIISEFEDKVLKSVTKYAENFIDNFLDKVSGTILDMIIQEVRTNEFIKKEFQGGVYDIFINQISGDGVSTISEELKKSLTSVVSKALKAFNLNFILFKATDTVKSKIHEAVSLLRQNQEEINTFINKTGTSVIPPEVQKLLDKVEEFVGLTKEQVRDIVFNIADTTKEMFLDFIRKQVMKGLSFADEAYKALQEKVKEGISFVMDKFFEALKKLGEKLGTSKLVTKLKQIWEKIKEGINKIKEWIKGVIEKLRGHIEKKVTLYWDNEEVHRLLVKQYHKTAFGMKPRIILRKNRYRGEKDEKNKFEKSTNIQLYSKEYASEPNDVLDIAEIKEIIIKFKNIIDKFIDGVRSIANIKNIKNFFSTFTEGFMMGLAKIFDPYNGIVAQIKTFFQEELLEMIKKWFWEKVEEGKQMVLAHIDAIISNVTGIHSFSTAGLIEQFKAVKGNTGQKIWEVIKIVLDMILTSLEPIHILPPKGTDKDITLFRMVIPIYGIPFTIKFDLHYWYKYGLDLVFGQNLTIMLDAYGGAGVSVRLSAGIDIGILGFFCWIDGLLGDGVVGIKPGFSLGRFKIMLDAYIRIEAFKLGIGVTVKYPWICFVKVKIWFVRIWLPYPCIKEKSWGCSTKAGIYYEKHWVKEF